MNTLLPPDTLFIYLFGRPPLPSSGIDYQLRDSLKAALLESVLNDMAQFGTDPQVFLSDFSRRLGGLPPPAPANENPGTELVAAWDRLGDILHETMIAMTNAQAQALLNRPAPD
jgi:hypothetical protein